LNDGVKNEWVKEKRRKAGRPGPGGAAIPLYRGRVATTPAVARELIGGVPEARAKPDLQAAFEFLRSQPSVNKKRIAATGWCIYGHLATDPETLKKSALRFLDGSAARITASRSMTSTNSRRP
jgi:dienelactone hydrolase